MEKNGSVVKTIWEKKVKAKMLKYSAFDLGAAALMGINNAILFPWAYCRI